MTARQPERLEDAFRYDAESGVLTRIFKGGQTRIIGSKKTTDGYTKTSLNGREYPAHRLIWWIAYGSLPDRFIDHINGDKSDNRLSNLRLATDSENKRNVGKRQHNTSGFKGVTWDKANKRWLAHATFQGKGVHLGRHSTPEAAAQAYREFAEQNHGSFYRDPQS